LRPHPSHLRGLNRISISFHYAVAKLSHTLHHVDDFQQRHASIIFANFERAQSRSGWHVVTSITSAEPHSKSSCGPSHPPDLSADIAISLRSKLNKELQLNIAAVYISGSIQKVSLHPSLR
jgi:hypothetical protein